MANAKLFTDVKVINVNGFERIVVTPVGFKEGQVVDYQMFTNLEERDGKVFCSDIYFDEDMNVDRVGEVKEITVEGGVGDFVLNMWSRAKEFYKEVELPKGYVPVGFSNHCLAYLESFKYRGKMRYRPMLAMFNVGRANYINVAETLSLHAKSFESENIARHYAKKMFDVFRREPNKGLETLKVEWA